MSTTHAESQTYAPPPAPAGDDLGRAMPALAWDDDPPVPPPATAGGDYGAAGRYARGLLAALIEAARDCEAVAELLEARDLTAAEAAAVLTAERPGLPFRLMETATEVCGFPVHVGAESGRTCSAAVYPAGGRMRAFHGTAWRTVVADVLAAFGAEAGGQ
jgi:hypothetical protein